MEPMDRREFSALLPALLAGCELVPETAEAQNSLPMLGVWRLSAIAVKAWISGGTRVQPVPDGDVEGGKYSPGDA
jgi:hypothetical protein